MTATELARDGIESAQALTTGLGRRMASRVRAIRGRHLVVIDAIATVFGVILALEFRFDGSLTAAEVAAFLPFLAIPVLVRPVINVRFGLYRRVWGHASVPELYQVVLAVLAGSLASLAAYLPLVILGAPGATAFPRSFWILELILSLALVGGSRFVIRAVSELGTRTVVDGELVSLTPALLFGAGRSGALMARSAMREPKAGVIPVGFLDEDPSQHGGNVAGLEVFGGLEVLEEAVHRTNAKMLLITMPSASGESVRRVMDRAVELGLTVRIVPPVHELISGGHDATRLREVRLSDLLARQQATEHAPGVADVIRDQVVMITGAGGSIGSELARQVYSFGPRELVLVDRAESPLYLIQRELELRAQDGRGSGALSIHLANVASRAVVKRLIGSTRPAVIFHAAACKHVPMMEEHPSEGVQVNVGGTMTVLAAAEEAGVPRFVLVSTDKAVEPSSVMGATKRIAEWLVADAARRTNRKYVAVRFGNVLGSAGSALPIFQSQLENGEAITITHPEMSRYFMTIQEAGWLILDAAAIGRPGDLYVLDMGEPIKIVDMVRDLIRLAGRDVASVPIRFTGLRPGEKLHERLFYETENVQLTDVDKLFRVLDVEAPADVVQRARELVQHAYGEQDERLRELLFAAVATTPPGTAAGPATTSAPASTTVATPTTVTMPPRTPATQPSVVDLPPVSPMSARSRESSDAAGVRASRSNG